MASFADDFNRTDAATLGANWSTPVSGAFKVTSNQCAINAVSVYSIITYGTACDTDDNWSQITVASYGTVNPGMGTTCRASNTAATFYLFRQSSSNTILYKVVTGTATQLGDTITRTAVAGDVFKVSAQGSTITGYTNGEQAIQATDTGITSGRYVGMRAYTDTASGAFDDWSGGDIATSTTLVTYSRRLVIG